MSEKPDEIATLKAQVKALKAAMLSMNKSLEVAINYGITADELLRALVETHQHPESVLAAYKKKAGEVDASVTYNVTSDAQVGASLERQASVVMWIEEAIKSRQ